MEKKAQTRVRCNECGHRINLIGNTINIKCSVTDMMEPLNESLICDDFVPRKSAKLKIVKE
jgi:hypothetical protein